MVYQESNKSGNQTFNYKSNINWRSDVNCASKCKDMVRFKYE